MKEKDRISVPRQWLWIAAFAVSAVLIAIIGISRQRITEDHVYAERARDLAATGILKAGQVAEWRKERLADAIRFAQGPTLTRAIAKTDDSDLHTMLVLNRKGSFYEDALLLSQTGAIVRSATDAPIPTTPATQRAVAIALATRSPTLSDFFTSADGGVHIDTAAPVCEADGRLIGALILRSDAEDFLYPLIRSWPVTSRSAETLLVRREGKDVVYLNTPRHPIDKAMKLRVSLTKTDVPAVQAVLGKQGLFLGRDYRDVEVVSFLHPIANSDWFLVAKVDRSELLSEVHYRTVMTTRLVILGILFVAAVAAFGSRLQQAHVYRNLYRVEREQRAANEKFRTILYSIGDAVITSDDKGHVLQMNAVAEQLTGWPESEASGRPIEDVFHIVSEDTRAPVQSPVWRVLHGGETVELANPSVLLARDGKEHLISDSGAPIRGENGQLTGVVMVFRDQTAEHASQQALRESERRLSTLMNNLPGMAYRCNYDTYWTMHFVSEGCFALTGYSPADLIDNSRLAYADLIHPDDRQYVWNTVTQALSTRQPFTMEYRIRTADWGEKWVWERGCAIMGTDGSVQALEGFITDISERKRASVEQAKLEEQLHQSQKIEAVGRLAGGVAHDFNNMLSVIIGNAELAMGRLGNANPVHSELSEIMTASSHSIKLVKQLLAFASKQTIMPRHLNLNDTISGMLVMLRRLAGEEIVVEWHPDTALWSVLLDPGQLDQILVNLIVNARDSITDVGRITIETRNVPCSTLAAGAPPDGAAAVDYVLFSISDSGCGMDATTKSRIFEPFFTTKQSGAGSGLGLPSVYGIVKQNKGFIELDSKPGSGSRFAIYLPRQDAPASLPDSQKEVSLAPPSGTETILLVEDEPALLALAQTLLNKLGYAVLPASSAEEALERVNAFTGTIHLLMTDVVMPGMSGRDLWKQLSRQYPDLKVLFMSGYTADIIANRGMSEGDFQFIQKPFTLGKLAAKLRTTLSS